MFWKNISSHSHAFLLLIFNALRCIFKNRVIFLKRCFSRFSIDPIYFSINRNSFFKKILVSLFLVWLIEPVFRSIEHRESGFLKKLQIWLVQTTFSKTFQNSFSLSDSTRLHKDFFVVFLQISCKVSLSLSRHVYITLLSALFFSFSCIISWFLGNFWTMLNLGFLINQALVYEFDQWVLLLQWCIHDLCWKIWSIWSFVKNQNF